MLGSLLVSYLGEEIFDDSCTAIMCCIILFTGSAVACMDEFMVGDLAYGGLCMGAAFVVTLRWSRLFSCN